MMSFLYKTLLTFLLIFNHNSFLSNDKKTEELLSICLDRTGGLKNWRDISNIRILSDISGNDIVLNDSHKLFETTYSLDLKYFHTRDSLVQTLACEKGIFIKKESDEWSFVMKSDGMIPYPSMCSYYLMIYWLYVENEKAPKIDMNETETHYLLSYLEIRGKQNIEVSIYISKETYLLQKVVRSSNLFDKPAVLYFQDYKQFGSFFLPSKLTINHPDGKKTIDFRKKIQFNIIQSDMISEILK